MSIGAIATFALSRIVIKRTPEEQEAINLLSINKQKAKYMIFCINLLKSIKTNGISIEFMDNELKTVQFTVVNFLLEFESEREYYYSKNFMVTVEYLKTIGNPIFDVWDRFITDCKEKDPFRIK